MDIEIVWKNIIKNEGEKFHTKTGIEFLYVVNGDSIQPAPINGSKIFPITKTTIEQSIELMPFKNTVPLQVFRAPSYIYAILTDKRIL